MDALSEVLKVLRLTSAVFFNAHFTAPWGVLSTSVETVAPLLAPDCDRVVIYHLVTEGRATVQVDGYGPASLQAGDIVVFPHGHGHILSNGNPPELLDAAASLSDSLSKPLAVVRGGGGGEATRFVCGYFGCARHSGQHVLASLPAVLTVHLGGNAEGDWLERSIRYSVAAASARGPGQLALVSKLSEALFVETLRRYMEALPAGGRGWLAGARDPLVGRALALIHRNPAQCRTLAALASATGASRSVLSERFTQVLGEPPIAYLTRWRLQLGAQLLETTTRSVLDVACEVGYQSEAAFSRAFRREFGVPPGRFRRRRDPVRVPVGTVV